MKKRIVSAVLLLTLLLTCVPFASSKANIFFVAYNDTVPLTLSVDDGLLSYQNVLLAPHMVFHVNGVNLTTAYDAEEKTMTVYSRNKRLKFDLSEGVVTDENSVVRPTLCAYRNQVIFLPVELCAEHFGLRASVLTSREGYAVLRFTNGTQMYEDAEFMQKAENLISYRVQHFLGGQSGKMPDIPPVDDPEFPNEPADPGKASAVIYLAVLNAETMEQSLTLLRQAKIPAVFYLTEEEIRQHPALVRAIRAADYPLGLTVAPDETLVVEKLNAANEALDDVTQSKTLLAMLSEDQQDMAPGYFSVDLNAAVHPSEVENVKKPYLIVCRDNTREILAELYPIGVAYRRIRETTRF